MTFLIPPMPHIKSMLQRFGSLVLLGRKMIMLLLHLDHLLLATTSSIHTANILSAIRTRKTIFFRVCGSAALDAPDDWMLEDLANGGASFGDGVHHAKENSLDGWTANHLDCLENCAAIGCSTGLIRDLSIGIGVLLEPLVPSTGELIVVIR